MHLARRAVGLEVEEGGRLTLRGSRFGGGGGWKTDTERGQ